jgi:hypothetical protein
MAAARPKKKRKPSDDFETVAKRLGCDPDMKRSTTIWGNH